MLRKALKEFLIAAAIAAGTTLGNHVLQAWKKRNPRRRKNVRNRKQ